MSFKKSAEYYKEIFYIPGVSRHFIKDHLFRDLLEVVDLEKMTIYNKKNNYPWGVAWEIPRTDVSNKKVIVLIDFSGHETESEVLERVEKCQDEWVDDLPSSCPYPLMACYAIRLTRTDHEEWLRQVCDYLIKRK